MCLLFVILALTVMGGWQYIPMLKLHHHSQSEVSYYLYRLLSVCMTKKMLCGKVNLGISCCFITIVRETIYNITCYASTKITV